MKTPLFYHKRPLFGLDIGSQTIKVMQLGVHRSKATVKGYGSVVTNQHMMKDGVVTNVAEAAKLIDDLLASRLKGELSTNRVVMSVPVAHVFTRVLSLPQMSKKELENAVQLEIEQSVPVATKNIYYNYEVMATDDPQTNLVRMEAVPRAIVDSYQAVCDLLGLELAVVQTNIRANAQLCLLYEDLSSNNPYIVLDAGGDSTDVGLLDTTLRVTGTVDEGGNSLTEAIAKKIHISKDKAQQLKISHGLSAGSSQKNIQAAVTPVLDKVVVEIKHLARFYEERVQQNSEVSQILIFGGGANMPGLGDYITNATHIPTRVSSPWGQYISFGKLEPPEHADLPRFLTCAGLALTSDDEVLG